MSDPRELLRASLPMLDTVWSLMHRIRYEVRSSPILGDEEVRDAPRTSIIGPTDEELRRHAPVLHQYLHLEPSPLDDHAICLPVDGRTNFDDVLDAHWRWCGTGDGQTPADVLILALPDGLDLCRQMPSAKALTQRYPKGTLHPKASASLTLASRIREPHRILASLTDADLAGRESSLLREQLAEVAFDARSVVASIPTPECASQLRQPRDEPSLEERLEELRNRGLNPLWPLAVWRFPSPEGAAFNVALFSTFDTGFGAISHLRRLTASKTAAVLGDDTARIDEARRLITSVEGSAIDEDDVYLPADNLIDSNSWSPVDAERGLTSLGYYAARSGMLVRTVGSICAMHRYDRLPDACLTNTARATCWVCMDGSCAGMADTKPHTACGGPWLGLEFDSGEDAELFAGLLNGDELHIRLKSLIRRNPGTPRLLPHILKDFEVPWPTPRDRSEIRHRIRSAAIELKPTSEFHEPEAHESWPNWPEIQDFRRALELLAGELDYPAPPLMNFLCRCSDLRDAHSRLTQRLETFLPPQEELDWPAPLALCLRRLRAESEPAQRIKLAYDTVDVLLKDDAAVRLTALEAMAPGSVAAVFQELMTTCNTRPTGRMFHKPTLGRWQHLRRLTTRHLSHLAAEAAPDSDAPKDVGLLSLGYQLRTAAGGDEDIDALIRSRNQSAHGYSSSSTQARQKQADEATEQLMSILDTMQYLRKLPLVTAAARSVQRGQTTLSVRRLCGDETGQLVNWLIPGDETIVMNDGETYLNHVRPFGTLSLYPWVRLAPPLSDPDAPPIVWLLDGLNDKHVLYKSVAAPGQEWKDSECLRHASRLCFGA